MPLPVSRAAAAPCLLTLAALCLSCTAALESQAPIGAAGLRPRRHRRHRRHGGEAAAAKAHTTEDPVAAPPAAVRRGGADGLRGGAALSAVARRPPIGDLMAVTGYWRLTNDDTDSGNLRTGPGGYLRNMPVVMTLNTPMAIYGDSFGIENMQRARGDATPALQSVEEMPLTSLPPCKTHEKELRAQATKYTDAKNAPSVSLGCIWDGKMSIIRDTAERLPGYKWYAWLDIGMHAYKFEIIKNHGRRPWPNAEKLASLPTDKVAIDRTFGCGSCKEGDWEHFCHCIAATSMLIPASRVLEVTEFFYQKMDECFEATRDKASGYTCLSEQHILTQMHLSRPGLFHFVGKGYGNMAANLTTATQMWAHGGTTDLFDFLMEDVGHVATPI